MVIPSQGSTLGPLPRVAELLPLMGSFDDMMKAVRERGRRRQQPRTKKKGALRVRRQREDGSGPGNRQLPKSPASETFTMVSPKKRAARVRARPPVL